ncbi:uncharacterized protein LOC111106268 [Crassostrea virginica]
MLVNQTYQLTLLSSVDLDVADVQTACSYQLQFQQRISCDNNGIIDLWVTFHVRPINEYDPEFSGNLDITITEESKMMPLFSHRLLDYFKDRDCPKEYIILNISKTNSEADASDYFMVNSSSGFLYQIKSFDYEDTEIQCRLGRSSFLTITAQDGVHQISRALKVTFIDVDDSPPVFVNALCSTTCYTCPVPPLTATVNYTYIGTVITDPPSIKALDPDSYSTNITYQMEVCPEKYQETIVFENGTFILLQSFSFLSGFNERSHFTVKVYLQAVDSNGQKSDGFELTINVVVSSTSNATTEYMSCMSSEMTSQMTSKVSLPLSSDSTLGTHVTSDILETTNIASNSTKDIVIIVLATFVGIMLFVGLVIGVYKVRRRSHNTKTNNIEIRYEETSRNNETKENVYDTINHYVSIDE